MKQVILTDNAAKTIENLRSNNAEACLMYKCELADSFATLANLIQIGRDEPELNQHADGLLSVMQRLAEYNTLLNQIAEERDSIFGRYAYEETEEHEL